MNPYIELLRPSVCLMTLLALLIGGIVAGTFTFSLIFLIALVAAFLICGSGDVVNDYLDYKIDKISMPHRPIPSGKVKRKNAFTFFVIVGIVGLILAFFVSIPFFAIALFNFIVSTTYAYKLKKVIFIKNIAVSWLAASSFLAAGLITSIISVNNALILLVVISFLAAMSREILKDVRDVKGDKSAKIKTLPIAMGEKSSRVFAFILLYLACLLLLVPFYYGIFSAYYWVGAIPAILICIYAAKLPIRKSEKAVKAATYFVLLGFILGSLI
jgi:geranylgeranylglycerol-phosphate geranylgeranyltransferase